MRHRLAEAFGWAMIIVIMTILGVIACCVPRQVNAQHIHSNTGWGYRDTVNVTNPADSTWQALADSIGILQFYGGQAGVWQVVEATTPVPCDTIVIVEPVYICEPCSDDDLANGVYNDIIRRLTRHQLSVLVWFAYYGIDIEFRELIDLMSCDQLREVER